MHTSASACGDSARPRAFSFSVLDSAAMKDMTQAQAQAEAIRRWGSCGTVEFRPPRARGGARGRLARYSCLVSDGAPGSRSIEGQGETWADAFADARSR